MLQWLQNNTTQYSPSCDATQPNETEQTLGWCKGIWKSFHEVVRSWGVFGYQNTQTKSHSLNETMKSNPDSR